MKIQNDWYGTEYDVEIGQTVRLVDRLGDRYGTVFNVIPERQKIIVEFDGSVGEYHFNSVNDNNEVEVSNA